MTSFEDFIRDSENGTNSIDGLQLFKDSDDIIVLTPIDFVVYQDPDGATNLTSINGLEFSSLDGNSTFIPLEFFQEFDITLNSNETGYDLDENKCLDNEEFNGFERKCMTGI